MRLREAGPHLAKLAVDAGGVLGNSLQFLPGLGFALFVSAPLIETKVLQISRVALLADPIDLGITVRGTFAAHAIEEVLGLVKDRRRLLVDGRTVEDFKRRGCVPGEPALAHNGFQRFQIIEAAEAEPGNRRPGAFHDQLLPIEMDGDHVE